MLLFGGAAKNMILKTLAIVAFFIVVKIHGSTSNDVGSVTFDRLELQIEKNSKYYPMKFKLGTL